MPLTRHAERRSPTWFLIPCLGMVLAGCTAFERGAEQGDPPTDPVTGCPDLSGTYALSPVTAAVQRREPQHTLDSRPRRGEAHALDARRH